jgi:hypothetical protein
MKESQQIEPVISDLSITRPVVVRDAKSADQYEQECGCGGDCTSECGGGDGSDPC